MIGVTTQLSTRGRSYGAVYCTTLDINLDPNGLVIDLNSLYAWLARLPDTRQAQGLRYSLVTVLLFGVLAKLAGQDRMTGIAEWVRHCETQLAAALHLQKPRTPCLNTFRTLLGKIIDMPEFEQLLHANFVAQPGAGQSVQIAVDGKTTRGTIPAGQTKGVHLLAAYAPQEGWVLMDVAVDGKENEISAALRVLQCLVFTATEFVASKVVTADAFLTQRTLSVQIVDGVGDYLWTVKENQDTLYHDWERLFAQSWW